MSTALNVSPKVFEVVRRGFEAARLDPASYAVRIRLVGAKTQTEFTDEQEESDTLLEDAGVRIFLDQSVTKHARVTVVVSDEHDQIVVTTG